MGIGFGSTGMIWTLVIPAAVLLYYFFRKKYEERKVPSILFWEEYRKHTESSPFLRHLNLNALFYLQMAALLFIVLLLMEPRIAGPNDEPDHLILVVDTSATMLAEQDGMPLIERYRTQMEALIQDTRGARVSVIQAGSVPELLLQASGDRDETLQTVRSLDITYGQENLNAALAFAVTAAGEESAEVHVFTDSVNTEDLPVSVPGVIFHVHGATSKPDNLSIGQFGIAQTGNKQSAIAVVENDSPSEKKAVLKLEDETGNPIGRSIELTLGAGNSESVVFDELPLTAGLVLIAESEDGYPVDNIAYAVPGGGKFPVYVEAGLHELVHEALLAAGADVTAYGEEEETGIPDEAIVVTGSEETFMSRRGRTILFGRDGEQPSGDPVFIRVDDDPLFAFSQDEAIYATGLYPPFPEMEAVLGPKEHPLIQRGKDGKIAVLADPGMTDWPLRPSFPLFFWSVLDGYSQEQMGAGIFLPGERRSVVSSLSGGWQLFSADGEYVGEFGAAEPVTAPDEPGIYKLLSGTEERYLTVTLPDEERMLAKGHSFILGDGKQDGQKEASEQQSQWFVAPLLILILFLILVEWEVQRRHGLSY